VYVILSELLCSHIYWVQCPKTVESREGCVAVKSHAHAVTKVFIWRANWNGFVLSYVTMKNRSAKQIWYETCM